MSKLIEAVKKRMKQCHCHHHWKARIGVKFLGCQSYSFYQCDKCGKKMSYR